MSSKAVFNGVVYYSRPLCLPRCVCASMDQARSLGVVDVILGCFGCVSDCAGHSAAWAPLFSFLLFGRV